MAKIKIGDYVKFLTDWTEQPLAQGKVSGFYIEHDEEKSEKWIYSSGSAQVPTGIDISGMIAAIKNDSFSICDCYISLDQHGGCELEKIISVSPTPFEKIPFLSPVKHYPPDLDF